MFFVSWAACGIFHDRCFTTLKENLSAYDHDQIVSSDGRNTPTQNIDRTV